MTDPFASYHAQQQDSLAQLAAAGVWQREAAEILGAPLPSSMDDDLAGQFDRQRLHKIFVAGLGDDRAFRDAVLALHLPRWRDFTSPPVAQALQDSLAAKLYNMRPGHGDVGLISGGDGARNLLVWLAKRCRADGQPFLMQFSDPAFQALLLNHAEEAGIAALADDLLAMTGPVTRHMLAGAGGDGPRVKTDPAKERLYTSATAAYHARRMSGEIFYTLTRIPSARDARVDEIPYDDYLRLFFELCDQPWDRIGPAQVALIAEFDVADAVRITNNDGTDLRMSLVDRDGTPFTFCNSLIAKNVPGSEIFSAPRRDSVNGIVVARGKFSEHGSGLMENLTMEFKDGRLIRAEAERGQDNLEKILSVDEGAKYVGELGIGTNPHLRKHVVNGLLVEKIGGSFHIALGAAYKYTEYGGVPVKIDNGNDSRLHWDITTMLFGKQGRIYLDGRMVMADGLWIDPRYDILNRGWAAVPREERPEYWRDRI